MSNGVMGQTKADVFKRIVAVIIDCIIALILYYIFETVPFFGKILGPVAAGAYFLLRDGLNIETLGRQSVGKKIMKLKVVAASGELDYILSIKRNITLGFSSVLAPVLIIPLLGGLVYFIVILAQFVVSIVELIKVLNDPEGKRIGDVIAETMVVEE